MATSTVGTATFACVAFASSRIFVAATLVAATLVAATLVAATFVAAIIPVLSLTAGLEGFATGGEALGATRSGTLTTLTDRAAGRFAASTDFVTVRADALPEGATLFATRRDYGAGFLETLDTTGLVPVVAAVSVAAVSIAAVSIAAVSIAAVSIATVITGTFITATFIIATVGHTLGDTLFHRVGVGAPALEEVPTVFTAGSLGFHGGIATGLVASPAGFAITVTIATSVTVIGKSRRSDKDQGTGCGECRGEDRPVLHR